MVNKMILKKTTISAKENYDASDNYFFYSYSEKSYVPNITLASEEILINVFLSFNMLKQLIDTKIRTYSSYAEHQVKFAPKAEWLRSTWMKDEEQVFDQIISIITQGSITSDKLNELDELIQSYINYFDVIDSEDDADEKYEELFNTIIQIPTEVCEFLDMDLEPYKASFIKDLNFNFIFENSGKKSDADIANSLIAS
jgi:hypothetical protein